MLLWWDAVAWPYVAALWIKNLVLSLGAYHAAAWVYRRTAAAPAHVEEGRSRPWPLLLAIGGLGLALRFVGADVIPPGLWFDPALQARAALENPGQLPWIGATPLEPGAPFNRELVSYAYLHFYDAVFRVFGRGELGFTSLSAVPGALAPAAVAWLVWEAFGLRASLAAALVASVGLWPLIFSRWGYTSTAMVALQLTALAATLAALRTGRRSLALLAGVLVGLSFHTHSSSGPTALGLLVFSLLLLRERAVRRLVFVAWLGVGMGWAPFAWGLVQHPDKIGGRMRDVPLGSENADVPTPRAPDASLIARLSSNVWQYTGLPLWTADPNPRHALPQSPPYGPLFGAAALIGIAVSVRGASRRRGELLLLLALGASLATGVLSNSGPAPSTIRTCLACALGAAFAGVALSRWAELLRRRVRPAVALSLAASAGFATDALPALVAWPDHPFVRNHFCPAESELGKLRRELADSPSYVEPGALRYPLVFESLAAPLDASVPMVRALMSSPEDLAGAPPPAPFWYVARSAGLNRLSSYGFRCARGVAIGPRRQDLVIARVAPP